MATLVKLNSIVSASLVEVDGVAMAGISKIGSQTYAGGAPSYEDLTTYTEVDPGSNITVTADTVTFTDLPRSDVCYVYKDFGVDYFGDYIIDYEFAITAADNAGAILPICLSNTIGAAPAHDSANNGVMQMSWIDAGYVKEYILDWTDNSSNAWFQAGPATILTYGRFSRVGTTYTCVLYSDASRTVILATISTGGPTTAFRYLYALQARNAGAAQEITGYTQNFIITKAS